MIPLYMEFNWLGWINTLKPLIIPAVGAPFFIFLLRQLHHVDPRELTRRRRWTGRTRTHLWEVHLPLMLPALTLVGTFQVLVVWNVILGLSIFLMMKANTRLTWGWRGSSRCTTPTSPCWRR